jgi:hypothetical protein
MKGQSERREQQVKLGVHRFLPLPSGPGDHFIIEVRRRGAARDGALPGDRPAPTEHLLRLTQDEGRRGQLVILEPIDDGKQEPFVVRLAASTRSDGARQSILHRLVGGDSSHGPGNN